MAESAFKTKTMKRKNVKGLALSAPAPKPASPAPSDSHTGGLGRDDSRGDTLEIGVEFQLDLKAEDLIVLRELGHGNGGTVSKVKHAGNNIVMARKIIHVEAKNEVRKRIVRELRIMHECNDPRIVEFYGAFQNDSGDVVMCMEYMDVGSLDWVSKKFGPVRVDVLGKIAESVLGGLSYLYEKHRIMHRDLKPSNILVNTKGQIKLCDFGVSSELEGSIADTFVGTGTYMAPERIQGSPYTVKSDVWSVGLTLMELAIGKFPFGSANDDDDEAGGPQGILDLLSQIVLEPAPKLPKSDAFPLILEECIDKCLMKDPKERPSPKELYEYDAFLQAAKRTPVDLQAWATSMVEHTNRKSYPAPAAPSSASVRERLSARDPPREPSREPYREPSREPYREPSSQTPRELPRELQRDLQRDLHLQREPTPPSARATPRTSEHMRHESNGSTSAPPRPPYPARTSSNTMPDQTPLSLPIRPAPPPSNSPQLRGPPNGGLPMPPAPKRWNSEA